MRVDFRRNHQFLVLETSKLNALAVRGTLGGVVCPRMFRWSNFVIVVADGTYVLGQVLGSQVPNITVSTATVRKEINNTVCMPHDVKASTFASKQSLRFLQPRSLGLNLLSTKDNKSHAQAQVLRPTPRTNSSGGVPAPLRSRHMDVKRYRCDTWTSNGCGIAREVSH